MTALHYKTSKVYCSALLFKIPRKLFSRYQLIRFVNCCKYCEKGKCTLDNEEGETPASSLKNIEHFISVSCMLHFCLFYNAYLQAIQDWSYSKPCFCILMLIFFFCKAQSSLTHALAYKRFACSFPSWKEELTPEKMLESANRLLFQVFKILCLKLHGSQTLVFITSHSWTTHL